MSYKKLAAIPHNRIHRGCLSCPPVMQLADMKTYIAVGFGSAEVTRDGRVVFDGEGGYYERAGKMVKCNNKNAWLLSYWERRARKSPMADWRVYLNSPLRDREYQRQGKNKWVLVKSGMGFA